MKKLGMWIGLVVLASCGSPPTEPSMEMDSVMVATSALVYPPGCTAGNTTVAAFPMTGVNWIGHEDVSGVYDPAENWYLDGAFNSETRIRPVYRFINGPWYAPYKFTATQTPSAPGGWNCSGYLTKIVVAAPDAGYCNVSAVAGGLQIVAPPYLSMLQINQPGCKGTTCTEQWVTTNTQCSYYDGTHTHTLGNPGNTCFGGQACPPEQISFAPGDSSHPNLLFSVGNYMWDIDWRAWDFEHNQPPSPQVWGVQVLKR